MITNIKSSFTKSWQGEERLSEVLVNYGAIPGLILAIMMVGLKLAHDDLLITTKITQSIAYINIVFIYIYLWFLFSFVYRVATNYDLSTRNWVRWSSIIIYLTLISAILLYCFIKDGEDILVFANICLSSWSIFMFFLMNAYFLETENNRENQEKLASLDLKYSSTIKRFLAFIIDLIFVIPSCFLIILIPSFYFEFLVIDSINVNIIIWIYLYFSILPITKLQGTIGMRITKIRIVDKFGDKISFFRSNSRFVTYCATILFVTFFCFIFLFFTVHIVLHLSMDDFVMVFLVIFFAVYPIALTSMVIIKFIKKEEAVIYDLISKTRIIER